MKVTYKNSMKYKVLARIKQRRLQVVLRKDIADLGSPRQVSRALKALVQDKILVKLGYGVYGRLVQSQAGETYLAEGFFPTARKALSRLNVKWQPSKAEAAYNQGLTTQVPINPPIKLISRFNRKLSYQGRSLRFES